jgi:UDP-N-acetyl-D-mannosaminuronic acid dehydrogenase
MKKKVCVIGLGYIGLPTAALLASSGYSVSGVDTNAKVVKKINSGNTHIFEPNLSKLVRTVVLNGKLKAFAKIQPSDVYIICVPTPFHENNKIPLPNIDYVLSAARSLAPFLKFGDLVILESTSPVGTTEKVKKELIRINSHTNGIHIAYCPERVLPGKILTEIIMNDRIIGGITSKSTKIVADFYKGFVKGKVYETDQKTAEMCKLTENSFRDLNIAFANELSMICDKQGIDIWNLIYLANKHPRVDILQPSIGVGGHCIAVDPWFIISQDKKNSKLIHTARKINNYKTEWVINKIKKTLEKKKFLKKNKKIKIACLGLTYKPDVDDLRESRALKIVKALLEKGFNVSGVDPNVKTNLGFSVLNLSEAIKWADVICILVKHQQFLTIKTKKKLIKLDALDFCGALK